MLDTYHHRGVVPLFVRVRSIGIDAVVDDLKGCHANGLHGAEVGIPEPSSLSKETTDYHVNQIIKARQRNLDKILTMVYTPKVPAWQMAGVNTLLDG